MLLLVSLMAAVAVPYSRASIEREIPEQNHTLFYVMFMLCLAGLLGITITGDAFNIFVFLEVSSLSTYVLIALGRERRALVASYQYLIMGTIGATFIVIGVGLLVSDDRHAQSGGYGRSDWPTCSSTRPVLAALAFLTVGISLKVALFPLHQWLPNAYTYAPSAVTAFVAATATKVSVYVLMRFYFSVFGESLVFQRLPLPEIMLWLSLFAMFGASFVAIFQSNLKRLFAYSSVGSDRLHHARAVVRLGHRPDRVDRPSVQPRHCQRRDFSADRGHCGANWQRATPSRHRRLLTIWPACRNACR